MEGIYQEVMKLLSSWNKLFLSKSKVGLLGENIDVENEVKEIIEQAEQTKENDIQGR